MSNKSFPVCAGIYHAIIQDIKEVDRKTKNGVIHTYEFIVAIETQDDWQEFLSIMFESEFENSRYQKFLYEVCCRFNVEETDFYEHIGLDLTMKISIHMCNDKAYPNIDWYEPYYVN